MKGILYSQYKLVEEYLNKLQEPEEVVNSIHSNKDIILQHKEKLSNIYKKYRGAFEEMAILIKEFEAHKETVRRLLILQNRKKEKEKRETYVH